MPALDHVKDDLLHTGKLLTWLLSAEIPHCFAVMAGNDRMVKTSLLTLLMSVRNSQQNVEVSDCDQKTWTEMDVAVVTSPFSLWTIIL